MNNAILVINTGSSSIKLAIFAHKLMDGKFKRLYHGQVDGIGAHAQFSMTALVSNVSSDENTIRNAVVAENHTQALHTILAWLKAQADTFHIAAIGHRVVHGGSFYSQAVQIDSKVLDQLKSLIPLAPLHQPHALQAIEDLLTQYPHIPQVACFDTAFHATMPAKEQRVAIPRELTQQGIRRYGFHGLSYEYIASVLPTYLKAGADDKIVIAHLGHGVSMCALKNRQSIATTMSFTPLDGLPMGTRSGAIDPAIVLYLLAQGMTANAISDVLHQQSGLLGLSGISDDMRSLLNSSHPDAIEAIEIFCYRIRRELGSLAAALGGLDALVFTGGIGEYAPTVRAMITQTTAWLGIDIDAVANQANATYISTASSRVGVWVIPTDEEQMIARHTANLISAAK